MDESTVAKKKAYAKKEVFNGANLYFLAAGKRSMATKIKYIVGNLPIRTDNVGMQFRANV